MYGPRPLPPSAPFSPHARITAEVKFAAFSTMGARRGYVRDALERDLSAQLQVALARSVRSAAYPKSGIDVFVTVLDCEGAVGAEGVGAMRALAGAITCASAAIADAGIECVDVVTAGIAAEVDGVIVGDPGVGTDVGAAVVVGYMAARDEMTLVWSRGEVEGSGGLSSLVDKAVEVAIGVRGVVNESVKERVVAALDVKQDVAMSG